MIRFTVPRNASTSAVLLIAMATIHCAAGDEPRVCTPKTCSELGKDCGGPYDDGCGTGGVVNCPECPAPEICNENSGICQADCVPDCGERECGFDPVCGTEQCGSCPALKVCGVDGLCHDACDAIIQNLTATVIRDTSAVVEWDTTIPLTSQLEYGTDTTYGNFTEEEGLSYFHMTTIAGLSPGTTYRYRFLVRGDAFDCVSDDHVFTTKTQTEIEAAVQIARADGAAAKTYYVKPDGDDTQDGLTIDTAWQSPGTAVSRSDVGDTILLLDGTWTGETIVFPRSGTEAAPITLKAYGGTPTLVDTVEFTVGTGLNSSARSHIRIEGLRVHGQGIAVRGGEYVQIADCEVFETSGIGIYFVDVSRSSITRCNVHDNGWNSVMLQCNYGTNTGRLSVTHCEVHDNPGTSGEDGHNLIDVFNYQNELSLIEIAHNLVYNSNQKGIFFHNHTDTMPHLHRLVVRNNVVANAHDNIDFADLDKAAFINNTVFNPFSTGIDIGRPETSSGVVIKNNIIVNAYIGIRAENDAFEISFNNTWEISNGDIRGPVGPGNVSFDPLFANPTGLDFHLLSNAGRWDVSDWSQDSETSPCIDAGDPASPFVKEPIPNGSGINMGAYGNTLEASKTP